MHEWIVCDGCAVFHSPFMMKTMGKSDHPHPLFYALFLVLHQSSFVSVVFDFNAFLNDTLPLNPMPLSVDLMRMEKEWIVDGCHLCCFFCIHFQD